MLRLPENNWPPKQPESPPQPQEESRNPTNSNPEQSPSEKSENTKNPQISWWESSHSKDWSETSPMNSKQSSDSKVQPFWPFKRLLRPIWLDYSKTRICVLFMPKELRSWQKTSNWPEESEEKDFEFEINLYDGKKMCVLNYSLIFFRSLHCIYNKHHKLLSIFYGICDV